MPIPPVVLKAAYQTAKRTVGDPQNLKAAMGDFIQRRIKRPLDPDDIGEIESVITSQGGRQESVAPRGQSEHLDTLASKMPQELLNEGVATNPAIARILETFEVGSPGPEQIAAARLLSNIGRKIRAGQPVDERIVARAIKAQESLGQSGPIDPGSLGQEITARQTEERFGKHLLGKGRVVQEQTPTGFRSKELTDESTIPGELAEHGLEGAQVNSNSAFADIEIPQAPAGRGVIQGGDEGFESVALRQGAEDQGILLNKLITMANSGDESASGIIKQLNEIEAQLRIEDNPNRGLAEQYKNAIYQEIREKVGPQAGQHMKGTPLSPSTAQAQMLQDLPGSEKFGGQVIPEDLPPEDLESIFAEITRRKTAEGYQGQALESAVNLEAKRLSSQGTVAQPLSEVPRINPAAPFSDTPISSGAFDPSASSKKLGGEVREDITRDIAKGRAGGESTYGSIGGQAISEAETKGIASADQGVEKLARSAMVADNRLAEARAAKNPEAIRDAEVMRNTVISEIQTSRYGREYTTAEGRQKAGEEFNKWAMIGRQINEGGDASQLPLDVQELRKNAVIGARERGKRTEIEGLYTKSGKGYSQVERSQELLDQGKETVGSAKVRPQTAENQSEMERLYQEYQSQRPPGETGGVQAPSSIGKRPAKIKTAVPGEQVSTGDELLEAQQGERIAAELDQGTTRARGGVTDVSESLDDGRQASGDKWPEGFGEPGKYDPTNPLTRSKAGAEFSEKVYPLGKQIEGLKGEIERRTDPALGTRIDELTEQINDIEARKSRALSGGKTSKKALDNYDNQIKRTISKIRELAGSSEAPMGPQEQKQVRRQIKLLETYIKRADEGLQRNLKEGGFAQKPKGLDKDHAKKVAKFKTEAKTGTIVRPGTIEKIIEQNPDRYADITAAQKRKLRSRFTAGQPEHSEKLIASGKNPFAKKMKEDLAKAGGTTKRFKAPYDKKRVEAKKAARAEKQAASEAREKSWTEFSSGKGPAELAKDLSDDMTADQIAAYNSLKRYGKDKIRNRKRRMMFLKDVFEDRAGSTDKAKAQRKNVGKQMKLGNIASITEQARTLDKKIGKAAGGERKRLQAKKERLMKKMPEGEEGYKGRVAKRMSKGEDTSQARSELTGLEKKLKEKKDALARNEKRLKNPAFVKGVDPTKKRYSENLQMDIEKIQKQKAELKKLHGI